MPLLEPTKSDLGRIARQWLEASASVQAHVGESLDQTVADIGRLQQVVEGRAWSSGSTYQVQCLGIAFGRVLARNVPGLDWAMVSDELGHDPVLRYSDTSFQVNVLTMISKRVETGQVVDLRSMYDWVCAQVELFRTGSDPAASP